MTKINEIYYEKNLNYANSKKVTGDFVGAIGYCNEAIDFNNNGFEAFRLKALCYSALKMYNRSEDTLKEALKIENLSDKELSIIYNNLGAIYHNQLKFSEAMGYYVKALVKAPDSVHIQMNFAKACAQNGKDVIAQKIVDDLIENFDLSPYAVLLDNYHALITAIQKAPSLSCSTTHKMVMGDNDGFMEAIEGSVC